MASKVDRIWHNARLATLAEGHDGLGVVEQGLVAAKDGADARGHILRLVCGSRIVTRALEATGLLGLFDVADGVPEALRTSA